MHQIHSKDAGDAKRDEPRKECGLAKSSLKVILVVLSEISSQKQETQVSFIISTDILSEAM